MLYCLNDLVWYIVMSWQVLDGIHPTLSAEETALQYVESLCLRLLSLLCAVPSPLTVQVSCHRILELKTSLVSSSTCRKIIEPPDIVQMKADGLNLSLQIHISHLTWFELKSFKLIFLLLLASAAHLLCVKARRCLTASHRALDRTQRYSNSWSITSCNYSRSTSNDGSQPWIATPLWFEWLHG